MQDSYDHPDRKQAPRQQGSRMDPAGALRHPRLAESEGVSRRTARRVAAKANMLNHVGRRLLKSAQLLDRLRQIQNRSRTTGTVPVVTLMVQGEDQNHGLETGTQPREIFGAPNFGGGFSLTSVIHRVSGSKLCLWVATATQSTIPSASGHKKTRCDSHNGLGDGGNLNMAQQLRAD